jgi:hypothetical protein
MYITILPLVLFCKVEINELPTFRPNQFFWDKYGQPGKDRAEIYAHVMREIMHDFGGLEYPSRETNVYDKYNLEDTYYEVLRKASEYKGRTRNQVIDNDRNQREQEFIPINPKSPGHNDSPNKSIEV